MEKDCDNGKKIALMEKDCDKKEGIKKHFHKRERFSQVIINKKGFKKIFTNDHK